MTSTDPIFSKAFSTWQRCATLRRNRQRFKQFTYGDQWGDIVDDGHGKARTERELVRLSGARPLTNNLIRRLVKTIVGRFRTLAAENREYSSDPRSVDALNQLEELDARLLEEFLISGCAVQRVSVGIGCRNGARRSCDIRVDNINPTRFFIDSIEDPRGWDASMVGVLHDMTLPAIVSMLAGSDPMQAAAIKAAYSRVPADFSPLLGGSVPVGAPIDADAVVDFFNAAEGKHRLVEVWTLDASEQLICHNPDDGSIATVATDMLQSIADNNERRVKVGLRPCETVIDRQFGWHCRWYAPDGTLLASHPSPLNGAALPFAFKFYPLTDGEVHPFVEDLIGLQKYINRIVTLLDRMIGTSAKGVLLFPQSQKPDNVSWDTIRENWTACDGVIPIVGNSPVMPTQVHSGSGDSGAGSLLAIELKLFEEVSGVSSALTGTTPSASTGAGLYDAQVQNATIALADTFRTFRALTSARNRLINMMQK